MAKVITPSSNKTPIPTAIKLAGIGVALIALIIMVTIMFDVTVVNGNEIGVKETWSGGVSPEPLAPKTYFFFPGFMYKVYKYDGSSHIFTMDDDEKGGGSYLVQSKEGQDLYVSMNIRWRIDTTKVVDLHKTVREKIEEKVIRPVVLRVVKDCTTVYSAIDAYSGETLVRLQQNIQQALMESPELGPRGIIIENFVIRHIRLDAEYVKEIKARQVAIQRQKRAVQEQLVAEAEALKVKAEAQADLNTRVVAAERDRQVGVLKAEQEKQQAVLAAEAQKQKTVLDAEAEKEQRVLKAQGEQISGSLKAQAILALGEADAKAQSLKFAAYNVPGADNFVKIQIAASMADAFKGIQGYLPADMKINLLSTSFTEAVSNFMRGGPIVK